MPQILSSIYIPLSIYLQKIPRRKHRLNRIASSLKLKFRKSQLSYLKKKDHAISRCVRKDTKNAFHSSFRYLKNHSTIFEIP